MNFDEGVQFDPGFVAHITAFVPNIDYLYNALEKYKNFGQKKNHFKMVFPKLTLLLDNYVAFYLGCILWASAIKTLKNKPVLNNFCCGAEYKEDETVAEVDFVKTYLIQFPKDVKYYIGKDYSIDDKKFDITKHYKEFLIANKGFTEVKTTDDIVIPKHFKEINDVNRVFDKIEKVIESGKLTELYEFYEMVF